jgi:type II secretory pathway pseudopilin PulG
MRLLQPFHGLATTGRKGISLIAVVIVMMVVAALALTISSTMSVGSRSAAIDVLSQQTFYIAEAGLEWYIRQLKDDSDWSNPPPVLTNQAFGSGAFSIAYFNAEPDSIDVTSTGKITGWDGNNIQRVVSAHVEKGGSGSEFADFAIFYGGGNGDITTEINRNQTITGDIFINGDLNINRDCTITGDVSATGLITIDRGTNISGTVTENAGPPAAHPVLDTAYYDSLLSIAAGQPAGNADFEAETISGVIYVNGDAEIDDYIDGPGTIVATGTVDINRNTDIGDDITIISGETLLMRRDGNVGRSVTFYSSSGIEINNGIVLGNGAGAGEGVVLLTPGVIDMGNNVTITGFIFGDEVTIGRNLTLTGNLAGNELISLDRGGVIIKDSTKVDFGSIQGLGSGSGVSVSVSSWNEIF